MVGEVTRAASEECGLLPGTPVVLGGGDGPCCRVGMGVVAQGDEAVNIGTSAFDTLCMNEPLDDPTRRVINFAHVIPGLVSATGTMQAAGASITWMYDNLCFDEIAKSKETGKGSSALSTPMRQSRRWVPTAFCSCPICRESGRLTGTRMPRACLWA